MIEVDDVKTISEMLKTNSTLTTLNLISEDNRINEEEWLKQNEKTDNKIGDEGAKAMSEMVKVNTTLTELNMSREKEIQRKEKK